MKSILGISLLLLLIPIVAVNAEERKCEDLFSQKTWNSEDHDDNKESEKAFEKSLEQDTLCETTIKHDHEKLKGEIDDWTDFKETKNYQSATLDQKACLKEYFDLPDQDNGEKALQGYELEYCGWDED